MQLKSVVFPAPLGPMRPTISPAPIATETSLLATRPPKRLVTAWSSSRGDTLRVLRPGEALGGSATPGARDAASHEPPGPWPASRRTQRLHGSERIPVGRR